MYYWVCVSKFYLIFSNMNQINSQTNRLLIYITEFNKLITKTCHEIDKTQISTHSPLSQKKLKHGVLLNPLVNSNISKVFFQDNLPLYQNKVSWSLCLPFPRGDHFSKLDPLHQTVSSLISAQISEWGIREGLGSHSSLDPLKEKKRDKKKKEKKSKNNRES